MIIKHLKLVNFRNYNLKEFTFEPGVNYIYGNNAIGKTNLVEGIYYFSLTRSFRTSNDQLLIDKNASSFYLKGSFLKENIKYDIDIALNQKSKKITINNKPIRKVSELSKIVNVISFIPNDVNLLKDTPKKRRDFLNTAILKNNETYLDLLNGFNYLVKERNSIIKSEILDFNLLYVITNKLVSISYKIYKIREEFISKIKNAFEETYEEVFLKKVKINIEYLTFNKASNYIERGNKLYNDCLDNDLRVGYTTIGIQKDDFLVKIDGKDVGKYGSQGENRLACLVLKLCIYKLNLNNKPILILDDILSELDKNNETLLLNYLSKLEQVFITSTKKEVLNNCNYCYLSNKEV